MVKKIQPGYMFRNLGNEKIFIISKQCDYFKTIVALHAISSDLLHGVPKKRKQGQNNS